MTIPTPKRWRRKGLAVNGFASTQFNVAVGGTDFYYPNAAALPTYWNSTNDSKNGSLKSYIPEQVWNDSQYGSNLLVLTRRLPSPAAAGARVPVAIQPWTPPVPR